MATAIVLFRDHALEVNDADLLVWGELADDILRRMPQATWSRDFAERLKGWPYCYVNIFNEFATEKPGLTNVLGLLEAIDASARVYGCYVPISRLKHIHGSEIGWVEPYSVQRLLDLNRRLRILLSGEEDTGEEKGTGVRG